MPTKAHIRVVSSEIEREGRYLITQRMAKAVLPLLWEFPGGRVERGETEQAALARELKEKIGVEVEVGELSLHVSHEYENYTLDLLVYRAHIVSGEPQCLGVETFRWVMPEEFGDYQFPGADQQTVDSLLDLE